MRLLIVTADPAFFTVARGIAGAMGHNAIRAHDGDAANPADLLLIDAARPPGELPQVTDPMRTVVCVGGEDEAAQRAAAGRLGTLVARRDLASELPRLIADFAL